ncbi:MAG: sel1 repeat family protein, partial [Paracoccaceae bacterium]
MRYLMAALLLAGPAVLAENIHDLGTTNPEEMTWGSNIARLERGEIDMNICASGYMMTKSGDHATARLIF